MELLSARSNRTVQVADRLAIDRLPFPPNLPADRQPAFVTIKAPAIRPRIFDTFSVRLIQSNTLTVQFTAAAARDTDAIQHGSFSRAATILRTSSSMGILSASSTIRTRQSLHRRGSSNPCRSWHRRLSHQEETTESATSLCRRQ